MKNLYIIGGTMGVGKTTVCQIMKRKLNNTVFLDGDWCWDMNPFLVTRETTHMVLENICFQLNNFIKCLAFENIVFCWVMHQQSIIDDILSRIDISQCKTHLISLVCSKEALRARLIKDIEAGIRQEDVVQRSIERLALYEELKTIKLDVSSTSPEQVANDIILHY